MADTRLYELEECIEPQADDILLIEESATQTDKKVKVSSLMPTDAVESAVADWLTAHPEATTTVEDGSITPVKLATSTMDLFDAKANTAGEYDDMTVGSAKQLLSKGYTENKTPYIYRASAGGDRVYEKLIGGTVAWNQLLNNTSTITTNANETTSTQVESMSITDGHKYIFMTTQDVAVSTYTRNSMVLIVGGNSYYSNPMIQGVNGWVFSASESNNSSSFKIWIASPNVTVKHNNFMAIDLTQLFGTAIADYIYSLEQSTAGAGVAYFRQMFPNDYYTYDTGTLQSVNVASKRVVGKNLLPVVFTTQTKSQVTMTVNSNGTLSFSGTASALEYFISSVTLRKGSYLFTSGADETFSTFDTYLSLSGTIIARGGNGQVNAFILTEDSIVTITVRIRQGINMSSIMLYPMIRFSTITDGTYEPYEEHTYAFDSDVTLRGIPKLDANNNLYYDGDVYESDGTVTRKYGIVDFDGSNDENWTTRTTGSGYTLFEHPLQNCNITSSTTQVGLCNEFPWNNNLSNDNSYRIQVQTLSVRKDGLTLAQFKTFLASSQLQILYPLATPTTETADTYINPQIVDADGTEEFVDYGVEQETRDVAVPVGHESKYMINLRAKIEDAVMLPTLPTANGTYTLKCTVASGVPTLSWVAD